MIQFIRPHQGTETTIVCINTGSKKNALSLEQIIKDFREQTEGDRPMQVMKPTGPSAQALIQAVIATKATYLEKMSKRFVQDHIHLLVMSDADMIMLRMMGVQIIAHISYAEFLKVPEHPDLAPVQRLQKRNRWTTTNEKRRIDALYQENLTPHYAEIVK